MITNLIWFETKDTFSISVLKYFRYQYPILFQYFDIHFRYQSLSIASSTENDERDKPSGKKIVVRIALLRV